jgi:hypothetical protein
VKAAKEQASKARQRLAAARPARTPTVAPPTGVPPGPTVAPPTGVPPGPALAEVTKLPRDNDSVDEKPGPKPDTATETETESAMAEPPKSQ